MKNILLKMHEILTYESYWYKQSYSQFHADTLQVNIDRLSELKSIFFDAELATISSRKRDCLQEEQADIAFNQESKQSCYVFYQHSDEAFILEHASSLTADDFKNEQDVYVVDKGFNWIYVRTHETGWCGPYFSRKSL